MSKTARLLLTALIGCSIGNAQDINTLLMKSTFELRGPAATPGQSSVGTVFILGKPHKDDPKQADCVLVTAAHVLDDVVGDEAELLLRYENGDGSFRTELFSISIRSKGANLYRKNPDVDVAVMYVRLPSQVNLQLLPISLLATDETVNTLEIHPGDELLCLGFPLAVDLNGFPLIRAGTLASYPLTPSKSIKIYYYNFHIFPGNSGGPVYFSFSNRVYKGGMTHIGVQQGLLGLVSQQVKSTQPGYQEALFRSCLVHRRYDQYAA